MVTDLSTEGYKVARPDRKPEIAAVSFASKGIKSPEGNNYINVPKFGKVPLDSRIPGTVHFYWYEATHAGTRIPPTEEVVNQIVEVALLAQKVRDKIRVPMRITSWYRPADINAQVGGVPNSHHITGGAIDFYADPHLGVEIYHMLNGDWRHGLGHYGHFPHIVHIDCGKYARWGW